MNKYEELRHHLLNQLSRLDKNDMTKQYHVINKCIYEMIRNNEFLTLETLAEKCNQHYIVQDIARYGKIVPQRIQRAIGGTSRTAHHEEINNKLASSGWRLKLGKSTCIAIYSAKNELHELDLNSTATVNKVPARNTSTGEVPTREEVIQILKDVAPGRTKVDEDVLKLAIEDFYAAENRTLKSDWWQITKRNLVEWSKKG